MSGRPGQHGGFAVRELVVKEEVGFELLQERAFLQAAEEHRLVDFDAPVHQRADRAFVCRCTACGDQRRAQLDVDFGRSEEHTSELQSLMRLSYAVFCLKTK